MHYVYACSCYFLCTIMLLGNFSDAFCYLRCTVLISKTSQLTRASARASTFIISFTKNLHELQITEKINYFIWNINRHVSNRFLGFSIEP